MDAIENKIRRIPTWTACLAVLFLAGVSYGGQQSMADWQQGIRNQVAHQQIDAALASVDEQIERSPQDLEAHGWRARILAWKGRWPESESEYRYVLRSAPNDIDILTGLADVLVWQQKSPEALVILDRARLLAPQDPEVLSRRAKVLLILQQPADARAEFRQLLVVDPKNQGARVALKELAGDSRHEFRIGEDVDTFNYTDAAQTQSLSLNSRWSSRWSTFFGSNSYQRFGQDAYKGTGSATLRLGGSNWVSAGGAGASDHGVIPKSEAFFEYGHGFRLRSPFVRALETSYQQHWFWYRGAHVLTIGATEMFYLPRDWTWTFTATGARSGFDGTAVEWVPSGSTKLGFPLLTRLSGNIFFAVGSETFAQVDQIGRFSARTYGGGLRCRITEKQDITGYVSSQDRSQGRSQNSFGLSYGIHF